MARVKSNYAQNRRSAALAGGKKARTESFSRKVLSVLARADPDELKYHDVQTTIGTPLSLSANTLSMFLINGPAQGNGETSRIGSKVNNRYLEVTVSMYQASAATNANIRCFVIQDNANNGSSPGITDLFEASSVYSSPNANTKGRIKFLRDELTQVNGVNSVTTDAIKKWHIPLDKLALKQTQYDGSGGTVASIVKGALYIGFLADVAVSASMASGTARSGIDYYSRFCYSDK